MNTSEFTIVFQNIVVDGKGLTDRPGRMHSSGLSDTADTFVEITYRPDLEPLLTSESCELWCRAYDEESGIDEDFWLIVAFDAEWVKANHMLIGRVKANGLGIPMKTFCSVFAPWEPE